MAEIFNNYLSSFNSNTSAAKNGVVVVPTAVSGSNVLGTSVRPVDSTAQIHSIFIAQFYNKSNGHFTSLADNPPSATSPETESLFFNLYIQSGNQRFYLVSDSQLPVQNSFYLEKTITLTPSQSLGIQFIDGAGKNAEGRNISVSISSADLTK